MTAIPFQVGNCMFQSKIQRGFRSKENCHKLGSELASAKLLCRLPITIYKFTTQWKLDLGTKYNFFVLLSLCSFLYLFLSVFVFFSMMSSSLFAVLFLCSYLSLSLSLLLYPFVRLNVCYIHSLFFFLSSNHSRINRTQGKYAPCLFCSTRTMFAVQ